MLRTLLHKVTNFIQTENRIRFVFKYIFPIFGLILFWGNFSILYLLSVDEKDCEVSNGILTKIENIEYKTKGRRGRDILHQEKHLVINNSRKFIIDQEIFKEYDWVENDFGFLVPSLKIGDTVTIYSYVGPSYIFGTTKEKIFRIQKGNLTIYPEMAFFLNLRVGLKLMLILFSIVWILYFLFIVTPWRNKRKLSKLLDNTDVSK